MHGNARRTPPRFRVRNNRLSTPRGRSNMTDDERTTDERRNLHENFTTALCSKPSTTLDSLIARRKVYLLKNPQPHERCPHAFSKKCSRRVRHVLPVVSLTAAKLLDNTHFTQCVHCVKCDRLCVKCDLPAEVF